MRISTLYLFTLFTGFTFNTTNGFLVSTKMIDRNIKNKELHKLSNKVDDDEERNNFDIIEGIGGFMGYPKERKWKGFRIACYSIFAGSILRSAVVDLGNYIDNKLNNNDLNEFSDAGRVIEPNYKLEKEKFASLKNLKATKILDEPYLCENIKYI